MPLKQFHLDEMLKSGTTNKEKLVKLDMIEKSIKDEGNYKGELKELLEKERQKLER